MDDIKHGQKVIEIPNPDGTTTIITEGYYEGLQSFKVHMREDIRTSYSTFLADVIKCLDVLKMDTPDLNIHISKDKTGTPTMIQKTWLISKQKIK